MYELTDQQMNDLENRFTYHAPKAELNQNDRYVKLRQTAKVLAIEIMKNTPYCREQSLAITNLEQAIFWANAAIARNE